MSATSWRRADVKYKNDAFVDVVESVNLSTSAKGNVFHRSLALSLSSFSPPCYPGTILRADVDDHIQMQVFKAWGSIFKFTIALHLCYRTLIAIAQSTSLRDF